MTKKQKENIYNRKRIYNFLKEDIKKLEKDIKNNDKEEIENFFNYWGQHLIDIKL